ncbi:DUF6216 family protein, partial [Burkholderia multivorans]
MNAIFGAAIAPLLTYLLSILGLAGFVVYAVLRLNSTQIIREKVWSTFVGDRGFNDEKLKAFGQDQSDLTRFRLVYGVTARSISDLHRLLSWMDRHHLTPIDVKRTRTCIDPSKDNPLNVPPTRHFVARAIVCALLIAVFVVILNTAGTSKTTLISMRAVAGRRKGAGDGRRNGASRTGGKTRIRTVSRLRFFAVFGNC